MIRAVYAGTFDPITTGHLDIIRRSFSFCDYLIVGVGVNSNKKTLFTEMERVKMIGDSIPTITGYGDQIDRKWEARPFFGLLVDFAKEQKANVLIRGIRSVSDFEYELTLAGVNKTLAPNIETIFLPTSPDLAVVSSSMVKEIARHNGPLASFVTHKVEEEVRARLVLNRILDSKK